MMTQCPVKEAFKTSIKNGFQTMHDMIATSPFRLGFLGLVFNDFIAQDRTDQNGRNPG